MTAAHREMGSSSLTARVLKKQTLEELMNKESHHPFRSRCRGAGEKTAQGSSALRKHWIALKYPHAAPHPRDSESVG